MTRFCGYLRLFCGRRAAAYDKYTEKYKARSKKLLPCQYIHSDDYADHCGNYWLYIAVHAHQSRTDPFLTDRDQEITYECGEYDEVAPFPELDRRYSCPG